MRMVLSCRNISMKGIIFFDCDETLRASEDKDWIWSQDWPIITFDDNSICRKWDGKVFSLREWVREVLQNLMHQWYWLGIISDNKRDITLETLNVFKINHYFNKELINIKLRDWYCPKDEMINDILDKNNIADKSQVILVDDKDYSDTMSDRWYIFIQVKWKNLIEDLSWFLI